MIDPLSSQWAVAASALAALALTSALLSGLIRVAPRLGLLDLPDARKRHPRATPTCGGVAIALGVLTPVLVWAPLDGAVPGYVAGALVVVAAGAWDDLRGLGYGSKLLCQLVAALAVLAGSCTFGAGTDPADGAAATLLGLAFAALFLVGSMNALNMSDGLDGLAGGYAVITLAAVAALDLHGGGGGPALLAATVMAGVLAFLRHNAPPARVFMGDAGSQFLGLTLGVLVLELMRAHPSVASAAAVLLVGLPVLDAVEVALHRLATGTSPFLADRNHLHHRLLAAGLGARGTVLALHAAQLALVAAGALLAEEGSAPALVAMAAALAAARTSRRWTARATAGA